MRSFILRVFRFDAKSDYEYYYKPYKIMLKDIKDDFNIYDVLKIVKEQDRYFNLPCANGFIRVDNKIYSLQTKFKELLEKYKEEIYINSIDMKRAKLDLECDESDFLAVFDRFKNICDESDFELYKSYKFLYYASDVREYNENYLGDSAFVFAAKLLEKYPDKRKEILDIVFDEEGGIDYAVNLKPFLYKDYEIYEDIKNSLKHQKEIR